MNTTTATEPATAQQTEQTTGGWIAVLSETAGFVYPTVDDAIESLGEEEEVEIAVVRGTALPDDRDGTSGVLLRRPGTYNAGDVAYEILCYLVDPDDESMGAAVRYGQAQAMAAGLNAVTSQKTPPAPPAIVDPVDLDAIRARLSVATPGPWTAHDDGLVWADRPGDPVSGSVEIADATFIARSRQDVEDLVAEVTRLRQLLDGPCGSCHPCTNYRDETWRAAERKPPHVIDWDDARAELKILRPIAVAAQQWAAASVAGIERKPHEEALYAAVQTLPDPTKHEALCPGFDCPGCRVEQTA